MTEHEFSKKLFSAKVVIYCLIAIIIIVVFALFFLPTAAHAKGNRMRNKGLGFVGGLLVEKYGERFAEKGDRTPLDQPELRAENKTKGGPFVRTIGLLYIDSLKPKNQTMRDLIAGYRLASTIDLYQDITNSGKFAPEKYTDEGHRKTVKNVVIGVHVLKFFGVRLSPGWKISSKGGTIWLKKTWPIEL